APTKLRQVDQPAMQRLVHCACRMRTPARAETPHAYGTVTSTGSAGGISRPCSQPAVCPEKTAPSGIRRPSALSTNAPLSPKPRPGIEAAGDALPARPSELLAAEPSRLGLSDRERATRELLGNNRTPRHDPELVATHPTCPPRLLRTTFRRTALCDPAIGPKS